LLKVHPEPRSFTPAFKDRASRGRTGEAIFHTHTKEKLEAWKITPGALDWLIRQTK
jgi:hypothetical protein